MLEIIDTHRNRFIEFKETALLIKESFYNFMKLSLIYKKNLHSRHI